MRIYHYDPTTGEYLGEGNADPNPLDVGKFLLPAHATFESPPLEQPSQRRIWDGLTWQYKNLPEPDPKPEPSLEDAIAIKKSQIDAERDRRISRFNWNDRDWDFDSESQRLIFSEATSANIGIRPDGDAWVDADNNEVPLTNAEVIALTKAGREHFERLFWQAREHKAGLSSLETIAAVEAYSDWPVE